MSDMTMWAYVGAGVVGLLWGGGYIQPAVALAFVVGLWLGSGNDILKWAVIALIAGYVVGSIVMRRKGQAAGAGT